MSDVTCKVEYLGPYSGVFITELGFEVARGVAFVAPKKWAEERKALEPASWRILAAKEAEKVLST